ncbi:MAG: hypothetical protein Q9223_002549 [Gallowayella weberi]
MPSRTLPNYPTEEVAAQKTSKCCWVTLGSKVYDVTDFLDAHPGGGKLILEYGGKDVGAIMQDEISHVHTESAYDILDENLIGLVEQEPVDKRLISLRETVFSPLNLLHEVTDLQTDIDEHRFLDLRNRC